jgi:5-methyltetrahydropteroyltriglutamate--homocysteine methyltransferase
LTEAARVREAFVTSIAVGSLEMLSRGQNVHYPNSDAFLEAIAEAMAIEFRAIVDAGFLLQIDEPGLPDTWDMLDPHPTLSPRRRQSRDQRRRASRSGG